MNPPTVRQLQVLRVIHSLTISQGFPPTLREIGPLGITSAHGVFCHLQSLERKGLIILEAMKSRAINLTDAGFAAIGLADSRGAEPKSGQDDVATVVAAWPQLVPAERRVILDLVMLAARRSAPRPA